MNTPTNNILEVEIDGLPRLVFMPENSSINPKEAIPADIFPILEDVFEGASPQFLKNLWIYLWAREIRKSIDFDKPQAAQLLSQAIKLAVKQDGLAVMQKIKEQQNEFK